ncbi:MAG TPA: LapA family protein [Burkholderiaceae bacterium]|nr:LapA family protein [Burkholderiaceae bacterium]
MRLLVWLFRAAVFFTLFAFALNNQQEAGIRWFFGQEWRAPMVFIVLAAFALGCALGVFAMVPSWWRHRRVARKHAPAIEPGPEALPASTTGEITLPHPPRDGL